MVNKIPELVCPAGDWASLKAVMESGADSVYFGVKGLNMRHYARNFDPLELKKLMMVLHDKNIKGYLALNAVVMNQALPKVKHVLALAKEAGVDAVILWDMAVLAAARALGLKIHLSTQASVSNFAAFREYARLGVTRIVLARECTLEDIRGIARQRDEEQIHCELECFIHGAMCVSLSGRCFLSYFSYGQSANMGRCVQPCRHEYLIKDLSGDCEYVIGRDYILSPRDLCTMGFLDELLAAGIDAFKIEGRIRAAEYFRVVTACYREGLEAYARGNLNAELKQDLRERLQQVYNRGFSPGFYFGRPQDEVSRGLEHTRKKIFVGKVRHYYKRISVAEITVVHDEIRVGDRLLFIGDSTPALSACIEEMQVDHLPIHQALKGQAVGVKLPFPVKPKDKVFLWEKIQ
ncbi:MAG: peptidase U32 family protein [Candidatus Omnitrophota bacterium]|jgi:putative protease